MPMMKKLRAWTLIETLIVIAILAILAAMVLPLIARSRDRARNPLHNGDRVEIIGVGLHGTVDHLTYDKATIYVHGEDGVPIKLDVPVKNLRKY